MKNLFCFLLCIVSSALLPNIAAAQNNGSTVVSGKITDAQTGEPVIGASVIIKGTTIGTISDIDGNYLFEFDSEKGKILVFSSLGYKDYEQIVSSGKNLKFNIELQAEASMLEETVVIGYGAVKKKDLSGAVGTVTGDNIAKINATNVSQSLQGAIPGLQVTRSSGLPGASATIKVRGITTMGDSDPLIILDGVQVSSIDQVNSDDIESITVLKDAASASIYGSRAAAGVFW